MKQLLVFAACLEFFFSYAQPAIPFDEKAGDNFFTLCDRYETYFGSLPPGRKPGYKPFKRWEWYWKQRVGLSGQFPPAHHLAAEYQKMRQHSIHSKVASVGGQWTYNGGSNKPDANIGRVNCVAFHPTDPNTLWVGSPNGGLWKTTDHGISWSTTTDWLPQIAVSDVVINPQNPNIMYLASGDGDAVGPPSSGKAMHILKSTDGGLTWSHTVSSWSTTPQPLIRRLLIDPVNPQVIIAATSSGIHRSNDAGGTWAKMLTSEWFIDVEFKPGNSNVVYASTKSFPSKIFVSTNNGITWTQAATLNNCIRTELAVSPADPNRVLAVSTATNAGLGGFWLSNNSGATYTQVVTGNCSNNLLGYNYQGSGCGGQGGYDLALALDPLDANKAWVGGINTWQSSDGGYTWNIKNVWTIHQTTTVPTIHADKHFLAFSPHHPNRLYECNDGGIFFTPDNGVTWTDITSNLGISEIYRLSTSATTPSMTICGFQDGGTKVRINGAWGHLFGGDGMECIIDPTDPNTLYYSSQNGLIVKTTNGGINVFYMALSSFMGVGPHGWGDWTTPFVMHPTDPNTILMGKSSMFMSVNGGTTWTTMDPNYNFNGFVNSIACALSNPQVVYASSGPYFHRTTNGTTWQSATTFTDNITSIVVKPNDPQTVWVTLGGYSAGQKVMKSADGGTTWTNVSAGLPNIHMNCILYQPNSNNGIYVGTDLGVFYRDEAMPAWLQYGTGMPNVGVTEMEISKSDGLIWAATYGRGLWAIEPYCSAVPQPTVSVSASSICSGSTININVVTPKKELSYTWQMPTGWSYTGSDTSRMIMPNLSGTLQITAANSCGNKKSATVSLDVVSTPTLHINATTTIVCAGEPVSLLAIGAPGLQWSTGQTTPYITVQPTVSTKYYVTAMNNSCVGIASKQVVVNECADIPEVQKNRVIIYPNPSTGDITVVTDLDRPLRLIDTKGQVVREIEARGPGKKEITLRDLPAGIYFLADDSFLLLSGGIVVQE